jgi:hypothetical protein
MSKKLIKDTKQSTILNTTNNTHQQPPANKQPGEKH